MPIWSENDPLVRQAWEQEYARALWGVADFRGAVCVTGGLLPPVTKKRKRIGSKEPKWIGQHIERFEAARLNWAQHHGPSNAQMEAYPYLRLLSARCLEPLALVGVRHFPEPSLRTCDINQTIARARVVSGHVEAITPQACPTGCRPMVGSKRLAVQSLFFDREVLRKTPDVVLRDLASNAFEASCCAAVALLQNIVLAHGASRRMRGPSQKAGRGGDLVGTHVVDHCGRVGESANAKICLSSGPRRTRGGWWIGRRVGGRASGLAGGLAGRLAGGPVGGRACWRARWRASGLFFCEFVSAQTGGQAGWRTDWRTGLRAEGRMVCGLVSVQAGGKRVGGQVGRLAGCLMVGGLTGARATGHTRASGPGRMGQG